MFEKGDIVYCINNTKSSGTIVGGGTHYTKVEIENLYKDVPYIVVSFGLHKSFIKLDGFNDYLTSDRFISEKEYQKSKRFNKILKLKECLK